MESLLIVVLILAFMGFFILYKVKTNRDITENPNLNVFEKMKLLNERDIQNGNTVDNARFNAKSKGISFFSPFGSEKKAVEYLETEYKRQQLLNGINNVGFDNEFQMRTKINDLLLQQEQLRGAKLSNAEKEVMIQELLHRLRN
jgi:uncharacterized protein YxeA